MTTTANPAVTVGAAFEKQRLFTPLGIQFWDAAQDRAVDDGLLAWAIAPTPGITPVPAVRTASGIYAFQGLPGLWDIEHPTTDALPPTSPPRSVQFVILVLDVLHRYLPQAFSVTLPLPYLGLFLSNEVTSPQGAAARAYLFSAVSRPTPSGCATVRVQAWDKAANTPAPYSGLQITVAGNTWNGIADENGAGVIYFPYPPLEKLSHGSPPGSGQGSIFDTTWPVQVQIKYQPSKITFPLAGLQGISDAWMQIPSLKSILQDQGAATIWPIEAGPAAATFSATLQYGSVLVLRTGAIQTPSFSGSLVVTAAP
jgi:hypothetical protein